MDKDTEFYLQHDVMDRLRELLPDMEQMEKIIALYVALDTLITQENFDNTELSEFHQIWEELRYPTACYTAIKLIAESLEA